MNIIRDVTIKAIKSLGNDEILLFTGARQAGKTTILKQLEGHLKEQHETTYFLNLEDPDYLTLLNSSPKNLLKIFPLDLDKRTCVFIDEVQYLANPSNFLKYYYDEFRGKIKILASGSSAFYVDQKFRDSLTGRKIIFNVLTLSFKEFLRFKEENDLSQKDVLHLSLSEKEKMNLHYGEYILYGGYPRVVLAPIDQKKEILQDIAYSYVKKDIFDAKIRQDEIFYKLFKILSSQVGNLVNASELASTLSVSKTAIDHYLYIMQKSFHIKLISPFFKNVRKELTKMPKVYFFDLGLRNFFADDFTPFRLRADRGMLLENAVLRQLLETYNDTDIKFWRTIQKQEIDFVVGEKTALEVKTNPQQFKKRVYRQFLEAYPHINMGIVSFDVNVQNINNYRVIDVWRL